MLSEFSVYFRLGLTHIADLGGYDHILFIAALCAVYQAHQWRKLLWLVTAFTLGHSITLILATLNLIRVNDAWIEFLIPLTILVTSLFNIFGKETTQSRWKRYEKYLLALGFGLVHGLGFSNFLRAALGFEESIVWPLFAFNVGLEVGQILILCGILFISFLMVRMVRQPQREWSLVLSGATAGIALVMMIERCPL